MSHGKKNKFSYKFKVEVTTYVLYSEKVKNPLTELKEGENTYRIVPIIMQNYDADEFIRILQNKIANREKITKKDLVPLALSPLMGGKSTQVERIREVLTLTREVKDVEKETIQMIETVVYTMADKFLNDEEMKMIKEDMKMTKLGRMLVEDGRSEGRNEGIKAAIEVCKNLNTTWEYVMEMLVKKFSLSKDVAENYMELYW